MWKWPQRARRCIRLMTGWKPSANTLKRLIRPIEFAHVCKSVGQKKDLRQQSVMFAPTDTTYQKWFAASPT